MSDITILVIGGTIAAIVFGITTLGVLGYLIKKKERNIDKFNKESIKSFMNGRKYKKFERSATPKVPTIKK